LVEEVEKSTRLLIGEKKVELKMDLAQGLPPVKMDRDKMTEVLVNIIDNAVKFTTAGSVIVKTSTENGMVKITVQDTGIGIRPEDIPKLFSSFTQVHAASHKTGGTGLGLAISKMIIEEHGGQIWQNRFMKRERFFIFNCRLHRLKKQQMDKKKLLILMVDDDEDYFSSSNSFWEMRAKSRACLACDGEECMNYLQRQGKYSDPVKSLRPGVILLDMNMPRKNGMETLKAVKIAPELCNIPVIMFTISRAEEHVESSYRLGANSFVTKPLEFNQLIEFLKTFVVTGMMSLLFPCVDVLKPLRFVTARKNWLLVAILMLFSNPQ